MNLEALIEDLAIDVVTRASSGPGPVIERVVDDSRQVEAGGTLFVARPGTVTDGRRFIDDAIARGATAVLADGPVAGGGLPPGVALLRADDVTRAAAVLAERVCGDPSARLSLVGVTGTNGKTTVVTLVKQLLAQHGVRCGLIGTVHVDLGDGAGVRPATLTTPPAHEISRLLARMVAGGCEACVMEVSSHALAQRRTAGLRFAGAAFTNVSGDHLDYHGTMEAYVAAKRTLFETLPERAWAVVNADDAVAETIVARCPARVLTTSLEDDRAACRADVDELARDATHVGFTGPWGRFAVALPLVGRHNVANALQAAAIAWQLGLDADALIAGLRVCGAPPGRLEPASTAEDDVTVLVDYAHTDDALDRVLAALRPVLPAGRRLWVVFGCGGDRDTAKRPRMAQAAARWADELIVTSDNPRTEDPERIIDDIMPGVPTARRTHTRRLADRAEAIRAAIEGAAPGDVVLIAGKGHEDYQIIGTTRHAFDDRVEARRALATRRGVTA